MPFSRSSSYFVSLWWTVEFSLDSSNSVLTRLSHLETVEKATCCLWSRLNLRWKLLKLTKQTITRFHGMFHSFARCSRWWANIFPRSESLLKVPYSTLEFPRCDSASRIRRGLPGYRDSRPGNWSNEQNCHFWLGVEAHNKWFWNTTKYAAEHVHECWRLELQHPKSCVSQEITWDSRGCKYCTAIRTVYLVRVAYYEYAEASDVQT